MPKHEIRIRWSDPEEKHGLMRALALLLDQLQPHLKAPIDHERFVLVNDWLNEEFKAEGIKRPTGLRSSL